MSVFNLSDEPAVEKFRKINDKTVLYFTAKWCPPCKMIAPVYEKLSKEYKDIAFGKIDVDDNNSAAMEFKISSVPTFVLFNGEQQFSTFTGADQSLLEKQLVSLKNQDE